MRHQHIDSHTDVSYQVAAEAAGGMVSTRDFVTVRHWKYFADEKVFFASGASVTHPAMPPNQPKKVRGENGPGGWAMRPSPTGDPGQTTFQWLLDTDLRGWIPRNIIESALTGTCFDYMKHLRTYAGVLRETGRIQAFYSKQAQLEAEDEKK